jgi:hypothetical protein
MFLRSSISRCLLASILLLAVVRGDPADVRNGLDTLEDLVGQLLRVQRAGHAARGEWQDQQAQLQREEELLRRRIATAAEQLQTTTAERETARTERQEATLAATNAEQELARSFAPIAAAEARLRALQPRLPALLTDALADDFAHLPPPDKPVTQADAGERLRQVLSLTTEIEQFDANLHAGRILLTPPGEDKPREMDVFQIGLAAAFVVAAEGPLAAVGHPGATGWEWEWRPDLAEPVRAVLEVYRKQRPAEFVALPLEAGRAKP